MYYTLNVNTLIANCLSQLIRRILCQLIGQPFAEILAFFLMLLLYKEKFLKYAFLSVNRWYKEV